MREDEPERQDEQKDINIPGLYSDLADDYPNWRSGIISGIVFGILVFAGCFLLPWLFPQAKAVVDFKFAAVCGLLACFGIGGLVAFHPPR